MLRPRHLSWLIAALVALPVAAAPVVTAGAEGEPTPVRFHYDWVPTAGDMPVLAAEDLGYFDEAGLAVTTTPGGPEINCLQLVAAGQQDICIAPAVGVLTAHPGGVPVVAVGMIQQKSPYGLIVAPDTDITAPADLAGHPIGVHPFDPQYAMWKAFEEANGLDPESVSEVTVSFGPEPLYEGQVDAIPNFLSLLPALVAEHYGTAPVTFLFADHGAWAGGQTIVANRDWAAAHPDAVTGFLDAYRRAMEWGLADPEAAIDEVVARYPDLDRSIVAIELPALMAFWESEDTEADGLLSMSDAVWQRSYEMLRDHGYLDTEFDPSEVHTSEYLPD
jgi:NitT/TauT family transport system substrate-binding protein